MFVWSYKVKYDYSIEKMKENINNKNVVFINYNLIHNVIMKRRRRREKSLIARIENLTSPPTVILSSGCRQHHDDLEELSKIKSKLVNYKPESRLKMLKSINNRYDTFSIERFYIRKKKPTFDISALRKTNTLIDYLLMILLLSFTLSIGCVATTLTDFDGKYREKKV